MADRVSRSTCCRTVCTTIVTAPHNPQRLSAFGVALYARVDISRKSRLTGTVSQDSWLYDLEYTRDFTPAYYGFAKLQGGFDNFPTSTSDNFLGLGFGYNIFDNRDSQWSVQAGAGYRVAELNSLDDLGEGAISLSSNDYRSLSQTMSLTNDTDIITSESDTVVYNDLGVSMSMTNSLALRASVLTEYHTEPAAGTDDMDNTFGLSLVYDLN